MFERLITSKATEKSRRFDEIDRPKVIINKNEDNELKLFKENTKINMSDFGSERNSPLLPNKQVHLPIVKNLTFKAEPAQLKSPAAQRSNLLSMGSKLFSSPNKSKLYQDK